MDDFFNNHNEKNNANSNPNNDINVNGEYHYVPPKQNGYQYYNPQNSQYFNQQQNSQNQQFNQQQYYQPMPPKKPKKKKNKTIATLVLIITACVLVSVIGINYAIHNTDSSILDSFGKDKDTTASQKIDEDLAKVEGSEESAKKDADGNLTVAGVAQKAIDSCVGITVYTAQSNYSYFYNYGSQNSNSSGDIASGEGSGVIMAEKNGKTYIITCAHVIADGSSFKVTLNDDTELDARMVGFDSQTDIGVLEVDKTGFKVASFGDSKDIELGEPCVAIGCPGGLEFKNSVTSGVVSALARPIKSTIGYNNECIQVDAAINPGNSGGALFNMQGQVIGINSSKIASTEYEGMGFAVPSNTAIETANSLIKNGYVAGRAKLGIKYNSLSSYNSASSILASLAEKGFKDADGTMVIQEVDSNSDLANKDIKQYDMIVAVNGETMTSTDILTSVLSKSKPGDEITLTIARVQDNSIKTFEIKCKLIESKE